MEAEEFQDRFINSFINSIRSNEYDLAEQYISMMCDISERVWKTHMQGDKAVYSLKKLQENSRKIFDECVRSGNVNAKLICMKFICRLYDTISSKIIGTEKTLSNENKRQRFQIIDEMNVHDFLVRILQEADIKTIQQEKDINLPGLLINMQITDLTLTIETAIDYLTHWNSGYVVTYIQLFIGWYLKRQKNNSMLFNVTEEVDYKDFISGFILPVNMNTSMIYMIYISAKIRRYLESLPSEVKSKAEALLKREFNIVNAVYVCGLIKEGLSSEVKYVFHPKDYADQNYYSGNEECVKKSEAIYILLPFCYLYYTGFCENEKFKDRTDVYDSARLLSKDLSGQYIDILGRENILKFLTQELNQNTKHLLQLMKCFAFCDGKTEDTVRDFCMFSLLFSKLYVPSTYWILNELADNEGENENKQDNALLCLSSPSSFLGYVMKGNDTHQRILEFLEFMEIEDHDDRESKIRDDEENLTQYARFTREQRAYEMYEKLDLEIKLSYKRESRLAFAVKNNISDNSEENRTRELEETIYSLVQKNFGDYISINSTNDTTYKVARLLESLVYTKSLASHLKNDINVIAHTAYTNLLLDYIYALIRRGNLQHIKDYEKFFGSHSDSEELREADKNYMALLEKEGFNLMLGSKYLLSNRDFCTSNIFDERTKNYKWITADGAFLGAAMRSNETHFYIRRIRAYIENAAIENLSHKIKISESGIYEYEAVEGVMIPFNSEDELRDYVAEEKKVIIVDAELGIKTRAAGNLGIYFSKR